MAINQVIIQGQDVFHLFDMTKSPISFNDKPENFIPKHGPVIYTVWDDSGEFIYIGACGLENTSPIDRFKEFQRGERSGNRFCSYVHEFYDIKAISNTGSYKPKKGSLDNVTGKYIRNNLFYRFVIVNAANIGKEASMKEKIRKGGAGFPAPLLNGIPSKW